MLVHDRKKRALKLAGNSAIGLELCRPTAAVEDQTPTPSDDRNTRNGCQDRSLGRPNGSMASGPRRKITCP